MVQSAADSLQATIARLQAEADSLADAHETATDSMSALAAALQRASTSMPAEAVGGFFNRLGYGLQEATGLSRLILFDVFLSLAVVAALWVARLIILRVAYRRTADIRARYQWRKTTTYIAVAIGAVLFLRIWLGAVGSLGTFLGLVSAGIAIALRDPLVNLAGWLFIVWKRPLAPGDRITVRTHTGDVIDQRLFQFTLLEVGTETGAGQSTGRIIHVPNGWVFTGSVINATRGFPYIWNEIPVLIPFEADWKKAKKLLLEVADEHAGILSEDAERKLRRAAQEFMIFYSKLTPTVYTSVKADGVELTLRYLVEPRRRRGSEEKIWEAILDLFAAHGDLDFAYPTQRFYNATREGKPDMRPPEAERL